MQPIAALPFLASITDSRLAGRRLHVLALLLVVVSILLVVITDPRGAPL